MGNVMVVLDEEHERRLRRLARVRYGGKKGSLSKVVREALDQMEMKDQTALEEFLELAKNAKPVKYKMYRNRSEIYDD
jgi:ribosomal protein S7